MTDDRRLDVLTTHVREAAEWWPGGEGGVGSSSVVPPDVAGQGFGAVVAAGVGEAVCPFAQQRFDQRFGFAVGLWSVGPREAAADAVTGADAPPRPRGIRLGVVGEHALDGDPVVAVEADRAFEEGGAGGAVVGRERLGVGQPRVVVDGHVQILPAGAAVRWTPSARMRLPTIQNRPSRFVS